MEMTNLFLPWLSFLPIVKVGCHIGDIFKVAQKISLDKKNNNNFLTDHQGDQNATAHPVDHSFFTHSSNSTKYLVYVKSS